MKKMLKLAVLLIFVIIPLMVYIFERNKDMPEGLSYEGKAHESNVEFLKDLTYKDKGKKVVKQEIFDQVFELIDDADKFIIMDMFLFNDDYDKAKDKYPNISDKLTQKLIDKKLKNKDIRIIVITDPINSSYGAYEPDNVKKLRQNDIEVVFSNLDKVRDSNPLYSSYYRAYLNKIPRSEKGGLPNVFSPQNPKVDFGSYLSLLNFKANHRKVLVSEKSAIVSSANPHDGSFYHSNIAFKLSGKIIDDIIKSEKAVLNISNYKGKDIDSFAFSDEKFKSSGVKAKFITEEKIQKAILDSINSSKKGDSIDIAVFYFSDRHLIDALKKASDRGVKIRLILDLNKDAFGKKKVGIPNKQIASELVKKDNVKIKWYETQGEQFHSKMIIFKNADNVKVIGGSANFTRRNLDDFNLEADILIEAGAKEKAVADICDYYDRIWNNKDGLYTSDYDKYSEDNFIKNIVYRIQEFSGLSTF